MALTHVALLRGINVGGKKMLPMKELVAMFAAAGCRDVAAYIQSGNVMFRATERLALKVPKLVAAAIEEQFGFRTTLVIRTLEQLRRVAAGNPFLTDGVDERLLSVLFLAEPPQPEHVEGLDPQRSPGDSFVVVGGEIFLHTPTGLAATKLTNAYFDSRLKTVCTGRNWRTVNKLVEVMEG